MLTVIILTKNEEVNIRRCLKSVHFADEIIVVDANSKDKTVAIAQEFTPHVHVTEDWPGFGIQKQRALDKATGNWVLVLNADEVVGEELQAEIKAALAQSKADAFSIPIRMNFYNHILNYSGHPTQEIRLFKREQGRYSDDAVNEKLYINKGAVIDKIGLPLWHYTYIDIRHAIYKINQESSRNAKLRLAASKNSNLALTLVATGWTFFKCFIVQRGFLDGKPGFVVAALNAQNSFYKGLKQIYKDRT